MLIAGDPHQDRVALEILAEVEAVEAEDNVDRHDAIETVAARRNFGTWGIEQYVELGQCVRQLEADRRRLLDRD